MVLFGSGIEESMLPDDVKIVSPFSEAAEDPMTLVVNELALFCPCEMLGPGEEDSVLLSQDSEDSVKFIVEEIKFLGGCVMLTGFRPVVGSMGFREREPFGGEDDGNVLFCHLAGGTLNAVLLVVFSGLTVLFPISSVPFFEKDTMPPIFQSVSFVKF